ncbi:MAG: signal peptidase I [Prevotella sp.]|jgi:signal peptidase I|nr:signal peptidase I [Prevotella sp.]MCH4183382.1 signal peptidase I [Prevotella sp.]MCH4213113.1 signal peptidase I [Prevotella sp.]MCH4242233.1 signal peptidase I [Prevotella sp.]MCI1742519.1 signal peptidase I [Prevotella sp.]
MLKNGVKFFLALLFAILVMLAVRAWAFTIFFVPDSSYTPELREGDRWIVNRLGCTNLHKGDYVVYLQDSVSYLGRILALPGDTIVWHGTHYRIPVRCLCPCKCPYCKCYWVRIGKKKILVYRHQLVGKAYLLFHLGF